jgi:hypothetical protein
LSALQGNCIDEDKVYVFIDQCIDEGLVMVTSAITNFDTFAWIALGLFIVGLIGVMFYERSSPKTKRQQSQPQSQREPSNPGTNTDIE